MRFKIDENLPAESAAVLSEAGHDALTIHDQRMVGGDKSHVASVCQVGVKQSRRLAYVVDRPAVVNQGIEVPSGDGGGRG